MWSEFAVPEVSAWREKLQREASASLEWVSPQGITYEPLYLRPELTPSTAQTQWQATRPMMVVNLQGAASQEVIEALAHDCRDFAVSPETAHDLLVFEELRSRFPEVRWLTTGSEGLPGEAHIEGRGENQPGSNEVLREFVIDSSHWAPPTGSMLVSTASIREQGGTVATELWVGLAALVELQRSWAEWPSSLGWATAISPQILLESAKCRAIRRLWQKFSTACGSTATFSLHGVQAGLFTSSLDEASNLLRSAAAAWVACLAGCQTLRLEPYSSDPRAQRLARNQLYIMREESYLQKVIDPLAGSYAIEAWSEQLARQAWSRMQTVEAAGGLARYIAEGRLALDLQAERQSQAQRLDLDQATLVGVTRYASPQIRMKSPGEEVPRRSEKPPRLAAPYESLRQAFAVRSIQAVLLVVQGCPPARVDFARGFLAIAGLDARVEILTEVIPDLKEPLLVLCSSDADLGVWLPRCQEAAKAAGQVLVLAGKSALPGERLEMHRDSARSQVLQAILEALPR